MTEAEVFQLFGLVVTAAGAGLVAAPAFYRRMVDDVAQMPAIIYLSGVARIVVGYLLVRYFSYWGFDWRLALTILGWLALVVGGLTLVFPDRFVGLAMRMWRSGRSVRAYGAVAVVMGVLLLIVGFWVIPV